jgi:hypothetical protein
MPGKLTFAVTFSRARAGAMALGAALMLCCGVAVWPASAGNICFLVTCSDQLLVGGIASIFEDPNTPPSFLGPNDVFESPLTPTTISFFNVGGPLTQGYVTMLEPGSNTVSDFVSVLATETGFIVSLTSDCDALTCALIVPVGLPFLGSVTENGVPTSFGVGGDGNDLTSFFDPNGSSGVRIIAYSDVEGATPLPAALPLFATGLGALGVLGWRRKRKAAAAIAAA